MTRPTDPPASSPRRRWSCLSCSWPSSRVPDHIKIVFHRCRSDNTRRRLVELPTILIDDPRIALEDSRRDWFESRYPVPPPPVAVREPRPATVPRPKEATG